MQLNRAKYGFVSFSVLDFGKIPDPASKNSITCMYPCMQAIMSALHELASTMLTSRSVADRQHYLYVTVHAGNHECAA